MTPQWHILIIAYFVIINISDREILLIYFSFHFIDKT